MLSFFLIKLSFSNIRSVASCLCILLKFIGILIPAFLNDDILEISSWYCFLLIILPSPSEYFFFICSCKSAKNFSVLTMLDDGFLKLNSLTYSLASCIGFETFDLSPPPKGTTQPIVAPAKEASSNSSPSTNLKPSLIPPSPLIPLLT